MNKELFAVLMAGTLMVPHVSPALGDESTGSVLRAEWQSKNFAAYLPELPAAAPWLYLDARTKLPKADFPLGRPTNSIGVFALQPRRDIQLSSNAGHGRGGS